jgi:hypothetical protein
VDLCRWGFSPIESFAPGDLEARIEAFVADYNHRRYHESIHNLTPADVYCGRGQIILLQRERSNARPSPYAACSTNGEPRNVINQTSQSLSPFGIWPARCLKNFDDGHTSMPHSKSARTDLVGKQPIRQSKMQVCKPFRDGIRQRLLVSLEVVTPQARRLRVGKKNEVDLGRQ